MQAGMAKPHCPAHRLAFLDVVSGLVASESSIRRTARNRCRNHAAALGLHCHRFTFRLSMRTPSTEKAMTTQYESASLAGKSSRVRMGKSSDDPASASLARPLADARRAHQVQ